MAIAHHLPGLRDVGFDCIERGLALLAGGKPSSQTDLVAGIRLIKDGKQFWLITRTTNLPGELYPRITPGEKRILLIPSTLMLYDGWQLNVEGFLDPELAKLHYQSNTDPFQAWMDVSELELPLIIRARKPGDQIKPFGQYDHTIKISDLMINLKLPKRVRSTWPLVLSGEIILWVPGYRLSEDARVKQNSQRIVHLTLSRGKTT